MDISRFKKIEQDYDQDAWAEWLSDAAPAHKQSKIEPKKVKQHTPSAESQSHALPQRNLDGFSNFKNAPAHPAEQTSQGEDIENPKIISISIGLPELNWPKLNIPVRTVRPWAIGAVVALVLIFGGKALVSKNLHHTESPVSTPASLQAAVDLGYKPLVPSQRAAGSLSPSKPIYDKQRKLYTFNDTYKGANLTINQQALPSTFKTNPHALVNLASSINATDSFTTTIGKAYISTDPTAASQRIVLANDRMLMFIQSTKSLDNASWVEYIQDLQ